MEDNNPASQTIGTQAQHNMDPTTIGAHAQSNQEPTTTGTHVTSKLGLTTLKVRSKRYAFPSVIVKTNADKEGVCVMLDVGLFCPFCAKSYKSKFSHKRSRLSIARSEKEHPTSTTSGVQSGSASKLIKPDLSALEQFSAVQTDEKHRIDQSTHLLLTEDTDKSINTNDQTVSSDINRVSLNSVSNSKGVQLKTLSHTEHTHEVNTGSKSIPVQLNVTPNDTQNNASARSTNSNFSSTFSQFNANSIIGHSEKNASNSVCIAQTDYLYNTDNDTSQRTSFGNDNIHDIENTNTDISRVDLDHKGTRKQNISSMRKTTNLFSSNISTTSDRDSHFETTDKHGVHNEVRPEHTHKNKDHNNVNETYAPSVNNPYLHTNIAQTGGTGSEVLVHAGLHVNNAQALDNNTGKVLDNTGLDTVVEQYKDTTRASTGGIYVTEIISSEQRHVTETTSIEESHMTETTDTKENSVTEAKDELASDEESFRDIDEETLREIELKLIENLAKMEQEERSMATDPNTLKQSNARFQMSNSFDRLHESIRSLKIQEHNTKRSGIPTPKDIYEQAMAILNDHNSTHGEENSFSEDKRNRPPYWRSRSESPEVAMEQILDELNDLETYTGDATLPRVFSVRAEKPFNQFEFESENEDTQDGEILIDLRADNLTELQLQPHNKRDSDSIEDRSRADTGATECTQTTDIAPSSINDILDEEFASAHDLNESFSVRNSSSKSLNDTSISVDSVGTNSISARSISKFASLRGMKPKEADEVFEHAFDTAMDSIAHVNHDYTSDYESEAVDSAVSTTRRSLDQDDDPDHTNMYMQSTDDFKSRRAAAQQSNGSSVECIADTRSQSVASSELSFNASLGSRGSRGSSYDSSTGSYSFDEDNSYNATHVHIPFEQIISDTQQMTETIHEESRDTQHKVKSRIVPSNKLPETFNMEPTHIEVQVHDEVLFHTPTDVCAPLSPTIYPGDVALAKTQKLTLMSSQDELDQSHSSYATSGGDDIGDNSFDQGEYDLCLNEVFVTKDDIFDPKLNLHVRESYLIKPGDGSGSSPIYFERKHSIDELSEASTLSSIDEFIPEVEQENAPPEVMQQAYNAALEVAKIFQHHHMIHPCFHKILEESGGAHESDAADDDKVNNVDVDTSTSIAEFEHDDLLTKDQTKQFLTHIFGAGHSEHKQKRSDLQSCIKDICASCSEQPADGAVVKSEEVTTQEVTLVFAWPKSKKSKSNQPAVPHPFREFNMRRIIRSNDIDVQVIEGPTLHTIEQSMGAGGTGIPLSPNTNVSVSSTTIATPTVSVSVAEATLASNTAREMARETSASKENSMVPRTGDADDDTAVTTNIVADIDVRVTTTRFEPGESQMVALRQPDDEARAVHEITSSIVNTLSQHKSITHMDPQLGEEKTNDSRRALTSHMRIGPESAEPNDLPSAVTSNTRLVSGITDSHDSPRAVTSHDHIVSESVETNDSPGAIKSSEYIESGGVGNEPLVSGLVESHYSSAIITSSENITTDSAITIEGTETHLKAYSSDIDKHMLDLSTAKPDVNDEKTITAITSKPVEEKHLSDTSVPLTLNLESVVSEQSEHHSSISPKESPTRNGDNRTIPDSNICVPILDNIVNETDTNLETEHNVVLRQIGLARTNENCEVLDNAVFSGSHTLPLDTHLIDNEEDPMSRLAMDVLEAGDFPTGGICEKRDLCVDNPRRDLSKPSNAHTLLSNPDVSQVKNTSKMYHQNALDQDGHIPFDSHYAPVSPNARHEFASSKRLSDTDLSLKLQEINDDLDKMFPPNKMYSSLQDLGSKSNKARSKRLSLSETLLLSAEKQVRKATSEDEITSLIDNCAMIMEHSIRNPSAFVLSDSDTIKTDILPNNESDILTTNLSPKRTVSLISTPLDTIHEGLNLRYTTRVTTTSLVANEITGPKQKPPPTKPKPRFNSLPDLPRREVTTVIKSPPPPLKPKPKLLAKPSNMASSNHAVRSPVKGISHSELSEHFVERAVDTSQNQRSDVSLKTQSTNDTFNLATASKEDYDRCVVATNITTSHNKPVVPPRKGKALAVRKQASDTIVVNKPGKAPVSSIVEFNKSNAQSSETSQMVAMNTGTISEKPLGSSGALVQQHIHSNNTQSSSLVSYPEISRAHTQAPSMNETDDVTRQCSIEREDEEDLEQLINSLEYKYPTQPSTRNIVATASNEMSSRQSRQFVTNQTVTCFGYEIDVPKIRQIDTSKYFLTKTKFEHEKQTDSEPNAAPDTHRTELLSPRSLLQTSRNIFVQDQPKLQSADSKSVPETVEMLVGEHSNKHFKDDYHRQHLSCSSNIGPEQSHISGKHVYRNSAKPSLDALSVQQEKAIYANVMSDYMDNLADTILQDSITTSILQESFESVLRDLEAEFSELQRPDKALASTPISDQLSQPFSLTRTGAPTLITPEKQDLITQSECTPTLTTQLKLTTMCSSTPKIDAKDNFDKQLWEKTQSDPEFMKQNEKEIYVEEGEFPRVSTNSTLVPGSFTSSDFDFASYGTLTAGVDYSAESLSEEIDKAYPAEPYLNQSASTSTLDELVMINSDLLESINKSESSEFGTHGDGHQTLGLNQHQQIDVTATSRIQQQINDIQPVVSLQTRDKKPSYEVLVKPSGWTVGEDFSKRGDWPLSDVMVKPSGWTPNDVLVKPRDVHSTCGVVTKTTEIGQYEYRVDASLDEDNSETDTTSVASNTSSPFDEETLAYYTSRGIAHPMLKQLSSDSEAYTTDSEIDVNEYRTFVTDALIRSDMDGAEVAQYNRTPSVASSSDATQCATSEFEEFRDTASEAETDELFVHIPGSKISSVDANTIKLLKEETDKLTRSLLATLSPDQSHVEPLKPTTEKAFGPYNTTREVSKPMSLPHANTWSDVSHNSSSLVTSPCNKSPSFSPTTSSAFSVRDDEYAKRSRLLLKKQAEGASGSIDNTDHVDDNIVSSNTVSDNVHKRLSEQTVQHGGAGLFTDISPNTQPFITKPCASLKQRAQAAMRRSFSLECPKVSDSYSTGTAYISNTLPSGTPAASGKLESWCLSASGEIAGSISSSQGYKIGQARIRKLKTGDSVDSASCTEVSTTSKTSVEYGGVKSMPTSILVRRHSTGSINPNAYPMMGVKVKAKPPIVPRKPPRTNIIKETPV